MSYGRETTPTLGNLSPNPADNADEDDGVTPPPSPSAFEFLQTAATLESLSRQLGDLSYEDEGETGCCCGKSSDNGCPALVARSRAEERLRLAGEIGNALLAKCEALEKRIQRQVEKYEYQLEIKRSALADSVKRVHNLERANTNHLQRYAEMSKKNDALDKRYTQALHTHTLTQQSLTHVRSELTALRSTMKRQSIALASGAGHEVRLEDAEKRYEETKDLADSYSKRLGDENRRRLRLEARIEELEAQLATKTRDVEEVKKARSKDAQQLLANAKEHLSSLHAELFETFRAEDPSEMPEYQRTLGDLVANNALLKHDLTERSQQVSELKNENQSLRDEIDELRSVVGVARRTSPEPTSQSSLQKPLALELARTHSRTESSPVLSSYGDRARWARQSMSIPRSSQILVDQAQQSDGLTSSTSEHGLGMGHVGEYGGPLVRDESVNSVAALSPTITDGRVSPKPVFRTSPSGGISYMHNGVPKPRRPTSQAGQTVNRSVSVDRRRMSLRNFSPKGVEVIAEWGPISGEQTEPSPTALEPSSPGSEYFKASEMSRRRRSMLSRADTTSTQGSTDYSTNISQTLVDQSMSSDLQSPLSESTSGMPDNDKRVKRRTLLLLTRSQGVQTEQVGLDEIVNLPHTPKANLDGVRGVDTARATSVATSPGFNAASSETSSMHYGRSNARVIASLIEYLSKTLIKLQNTNIPSLNKRLRKQHLPGDVRHLSRNNLQSLQAEIADIRHVFKGVNDISTVTKKDFSALVKIMKEVFNELIELQAIVNDVTIEPSLAKKLHRQAYAEATEEGKPSSQSSGLGWIAAPITKLFVTPAADKAPSMLPPSPVPGGAVDRDRLQAGTMKAPKLQASTSATTTHISVEFGGSGIVRRATPHQGQKAKQPSSSSAQGNSTVPPLPGQHSAGIPSSVHTDLGPAHTLRTSKSRSNRNELLGIFAGAAPRPISPTGWVVLPGQAGQPATIAPPDKQLRSVSSKYFGGDRTVKDYDNSNRRRLPSAVDAVIDTTAQQVVDNENAQTGVIEPPLLERTLRPRGLSDSSIRTTFINHEVPIETTAAQPAGPYGEGKKGYLESFTSRFYPFKGTTTTDQADGLPPSDSMTTTSSVLTEEGPVLTAKQTTKTRDKSPITTKAIRSDSPSSRKSDRTSELSASQTQSSGLLGYFTGNFGSPDIPEEDRHNDEEAVGNARYGNGAARVGLHRGASLQ